MVYANAVGLGKHSMQPAAWVGRWKFLNGWTKVWSCERHADGVAIYLPEGMKAEFLGRVFPFKRLG
jgi:hypothetical protein